MSNARIRKRRRRRRLMEVRRVMRTISKVLGVPCPPEAERAFVRIASTVPNWGRP